jgi:WD40 repeat protein
MDRIASVGVWVALGIAAAPTAVVAQAPPLVLKEHRAGTVVCTDVSSDGKRVIAANATTGFVGAPEGDRTTVLWDARTGVVLGRFTSECDTWDLAVLPDGEHFLAAQEDGDVVLRETTTGRITARFRGHEGRVRAIDVAGDGLTFVSCGALDGSVRHWDLRTKRQLHAFFDREPSLLMCVRMAPDGRQALAGGHDGVLRVYDLAGRNGPHRLSGHTDQIHALTWLSDGRALSGGRDRTLRTWDVADGRPLVQIEAGTAVTALAASPGGRRVLFGGTDGLVRLRDADALRDLAVMKGHAKWIWDLRFSADGRFACSSGLDGAVRLWPLDPEDVDPQAKAAGPRRVPGRPSGRRRGPRRIGWPLSSSSS